MVDKTGRATSNNLEGLGSTRRFVARRSGAVLGDWMILFGILASVAFLIGRFRGASQPLSGPEVWYMTLLTFSIPAWIYFIVSDCSGSGATLGKRLFNLRVALATEKRVSLGRAVMRTAIKLLP